MHSDELHTHGVKLWTLFPVTQFVTRNEAITSRAF